MGLREDIWIGGILAVMVIVGTVLLVRLHHSEPAAKPPGATAPITTVTVAFKPTRGTKTITEPYRTRLPKCPVAQIGRPAHGACVRAR